jgi:hypothetical protein
MGKSTASRYRMIISISQFSHRQRNLLRLFQKPSSPSQSKNLPHANDPPPSPYPLVLISMKQLYILFECHSCFCYVVETIVDEDESQGFDLDHFSFRDLTQILTSLGSAITISLNSDFYFDHDFRETWLYVDHSSRYLIEARQEKQNCIARSQCKQVDQICRAPFKFICSYSIQQSISHFPASNKPSSAHSS